MQLNICARTPPPVLIPVQPQLRVYQFDKLGGGSGFGLFHPNGNEVLVDEAVWDLRTHRLLRTLPCQDGTVMKPDPGGDVLYTYRWVCCALDSYMVV